ncbi:hypothetical protein TSOC_014301 [Tetrabaena socialis]|uniref:Uncharacterized protein n=1 Tax=Tetrabaena socialis TaxID=47790 RepID=A0A2J7ZI08_9CHLO|nr:hypothetical protein TSOC_014301 [Tetrabaena socialis]|eukprot:PNG99906.1 hypothetical protein TSOC_014301 [Tetrabaena socialis]
MGSRSVSLVDRAYSPAAYTANPHARLVGVGAACMPAPPALGGFGLLPLVEHVRGRHAALAARCLVGACPGLGAVQLPWALVALALLQHLHPAASPLCLLTARVTPARGLRPAAVLVLGRPVPASCPALVQLASAFSALPPPVIITPPEPGPWCFNAPLWGNPFLPGPAPGRSLDTDFADLASVPGLSTVGMAVRCCLAIEVISLAVPPAPPGRPLNPAATARRMTAAYHAVVLRGILRPGSHRTGVLRWGRSSTSLVGRQQHRPPPLDGLSSPAILDGGPLSSSSNRPFKPCRRITGHS